MAKTKKRSGRGYRRFLLLVVMLFMLLIVMMLRFGWRFLDDYEASQPKYFMDDYVAGLDEAHWNEIAAGLAAKGGYELVEEDELRALIAGELSQGSYSYARDNSIKVHNGYRYVILRDGVKQGLVTIVRDDNPNFYTFSPWRVEEEDYSFTPPASEPVEVTVPASWQVVFNGCPLDETYIAETGIKIPGLEAYYDESYAPEYLVRYEVTQYLEQRSLEILDAEGQPQTISDRVEDNAELFAADLYDNDNEDIRKLVEEYIARYVCFSSNTNRNPRGNLNSLRELIVPGSDLDQRMGDVLDALYWTNGRGYEITDIRINSILRVGEAWLADVTYVTDVGGQHGELTTTVNNARFTIVEQNGRLLVERHKVY